MAIIGMDFGNFNSFVCFVPEYDENNRAKGTVQSLLPANNEHGIPSVYYYSQRLGRVLIGEDALASRAVPVNNRLRYLKRNMGKTIQLDDRSISYDDAITEVVQHCIRIANRELNSRYLITTNEISISYPASFSPAQLQHLIEQVQKATLEDGRHIKVVGTIMEPAAAALDYLAEFPKNEATILTYDLGGGTFDLGLVAAYPNGKKNTKGKVIYYDIINARGIPNVGGKEFDEVIYKILLAKCPVTLNERQKARLFEEAERAKVQLSTKDSYEAVIMVDDEDIYIPISKKEFVTDSTTISLVKQTVDMTKKMLQDHKNQRPESILLTGGASQMPIIKETLEREIPEYKGKILFYRPDRAIAYGAAKYGTIETDVQQRVMYDIGVLYFDDETRVPHVSTFIKAGTEIPTDVAKVISHTLEETESAVFRVKEANKNNPDKLKVETDYKEIMKVSLKFGRKVEKGHKCATELKIGNRGILEMKSYDLTDPSIQVTTSAVLENLS